MLCSAVYLGCCSEGCPWILRHSWAMPPARRAGVGCSSVKQQSPSNSPTPLSNLPSSLCLPPAQTQAGDAAAQGPGKEG